MLLASGAIGGIAGLIALGGAESSPSPSGAAAPPSDRAAGGDDPVSASEQSGDETAVPDIPSEPRPPDGPITTTSVGPVTIGMPEAQVKRAFTPPDDMQEVTLSASGPAPQVNWVWKRPGGEFVLVFETESDTVAGYITTTPEFETPSGLSVGSQFDEIPDEFAEQLEPSPIADSDPLDGSPIDRGAYLLSEGKPGTYPALTFTVEDDEIQVISGGEGPPAGE